MCHCSSAPRSWPRWRRSSDRCSPTSCTPLSTRGSAMPDDRDRDVSGSPWSSRALQDEGGPGFPVPGPIPAESAERLAAAEGAMPSGGEGTSKGSMLRQNVSVFTENKLAVIGLAVFVFMVLFCFLGPVFYH